MWEEHSSFETRSSLIERVTSQNADAESWREFMVLYEPLIAAYIGSCNDRSQLGLSTHDREDVKQNVLVKLYLKVVTFDKTLRFRTWLWTVSQRVAIDWVRREQGRRRMPRDENAGSGKADGTTPGAAAARPKKVAWNDVLSEGLISGESPPDEKLIAEHDLYMLGHIFTRAKELASPNNWVCFELRYLKHLSSAEVATQLDMSPGAVDTATYRVLKLIRDLCKTHDVQLKRG